MLQLAQINPDDLRGLTESVAPATGTLTEALVKLISTVLPIGVYLFLIAILASGIIWTFGAGSEEQIERAKKTLLYSVIGLFIILGATAFANLLFSNLYPTLFGGLSIGFGSLVGRVFAIGIYLTGAGFLLMILFAGARWLFSGGSEDAIEKAKHQILHATIGMALTAGAYTIGIMIARIFGVTVN